MCSTSRKISKISACHKTFYAEISELTAPNDLIFGKHNCTYKLCRQKVYFFKILSFSYFFHGFSNFAPHTIWSNYTKGEIRSQICLKVNTKSTKKYERNQNFGKIKKLTTKFVCTIMLAKYQVIWPSELRYLGVKSFVTQHLPAKQI